MSATTVVDGTFIDITGVDENWDFAVDAFSGYAEVGPRIDFIHFDPGAADDELYVRKDDASGAVIFHVKCQDLYDQRRGYFDRQRFKPFIKFSECTLSANHRVVIGMTRG